MSTQITRDEFPEFHQKRVFFVIHQRDVDVTTRSFTVKNTIAGWSDLLQSGNGVTLHGIGTFLPPLKDGSILIDPDDARFVNIFRNKKDGQEWLAGDHIVKKDGFLARLFGRE